MGNTQHLQALSCFMKNAMIMIWLLAHLCFSAISKRDAGEAWSFSAVVLPVCAGGEGPPHVKWI